RRGRRWLSRRDLHPAGGAASPPTAAACPGAGAPWTRGWVGSAVAAAPPATPPPAARRAGPGRSAGSGPATGRRPPSPGPPGPTVRAAGPAGGGRGSWTPRRRTTPPPGCWPGWRAGRRGPQRWWRAKRSRPSGSTATRSPAIGPGHGRQGAPAERRPVPSSGGRLPPLRSGPMEYRHLGRSGLVVSALSYGNWITHGGQVQETAAKACVKAALDAGITTFDTADVYALG